MIGICEDLMKSVLQAAIQGKLTKQLPEDGNAEDLYEEIQTEKQKLIKEGKIKKEKPLPEITEDDIPFDIPENWKWIKLIDCCEKITDYVASGSFASIKANVKYYKTEEYALLIKTADFANNFSRDLTFTDKHGYEFLSNSNLFGGELILSNIGASIGKVFIVPNLARPMTLAPNSIMVRIPNNDATLKRYLYFLLKSPYGQDCFIKISGGTATPKMNKTDLKTICIPLPPISEQKRIVARVDELMKRIDDMEKTEKDITALYDAFPGDMKAALMQAAIQGKLTEQLDSDGNAEDLYREIQAEKQRLIKEGKIKKEKPLPEITDDDIPFDIPENWKWVRVGKIGNLVRGSGIQKNDTISQGMQCVRYGEIYTSYYHSFTRAKTFISEQVFARSKHIKKGDLIFTLTGENKPDIAKTIAYLGNEDIAVGGDLAIWSNHHCDPRYLSYFMYSAFAIGQKVDVATGDIIVHISCDKVGKFLMPLPPLAEQKRIVEKLDQLLPLCDSMKEAIDATA